MILDLIVKQAILLNFLLGNIDVDVFLDKYELVDKFPDSYFFNDFALSEKDIFELHISKFDDSREINLRTKNIEYINDFNALFLSYSDKNNLVYIHKKVSVISKTKFVAHKLNLVYNGKIIDVSVHKFGNYVGISLKYYFPKNMKLEKLDENYNALGIIVKPESTFQILSEKSYEGNFTIEEWKNIMNKKYEYWNEEYFLNKMKERKIIHENNPLKLFEEKGIFDFIIKDITYKLVVDQNDELLINRNHDYRIKCRIKGDLYTFNNTLYILCSEIKVLK